MARVLFVDDDPYTLETLHKAVQVFGHEAILAGSGEDALQKVDEFLPDIIFIDMRLPDIDGLSVVSQISKGPNTAHIPIFMLSAGSELDAADNARAAGALEYLEKPIRLQALLDIIQKYAMQ